MEAVELKSNQVITEIKVNSMSADIVGLPDRRMFAVTIPVTMHLTLYQDDVYRGCCIEMTDVQARQLRDMLTLEFEKK